MSISLISKHEWDTSTGIDATVPNHMILGQTTNLILRYCSSKMLILEEEKILTFYSTDGVQNYTLLGKYLGKF